MQCKKILRPKGFTLTELLVVVLVIAILAAISMPLYNRAIERSRASDALRVIALAAAKQETFLNNNERMALNFDELGTPVRNLTGTAPTIGSFTYTLHPACIAARRTTGTFTVFRNFHTNEEACFGAGCWVLNNMVPTVTLDQLPEGCDLEPVVEPPCQPWGAGVQDSKLCKDIASTSSESNKGSGKESVGQKYTSGTAYLICEASCEGPIKCRWDYSDCKDDPLPCTLECKPGWILHEEACRCDCKLECEIAGQCFDKYGGGTEQIKCVELNNMGGTGNNDGSSVGTGPGGSGGGGGSWTSGTAKRICKDSCQGPAECTPWDTSNCSSDCVGCGCCGPGECCTNTQTCLPDPDKPAPQTVACGVEPPNGTLNNPKESCDTCAGTKISGWVVKTPGCPREWTLNDGTCNCTGSTCCYDTTFSICRLKVPCGPETQTRPCPNGQPGVQTQTRTMQPSGQACPTHIWGPWGATIKVGSQYQWVAGAWDNSQCIIGCSECTCPYNEISVKEYVNGVHTGNTICVPCSAPKVANGSTITVSGETYLPGTYCICPIVTVVSGGSQTVVIVK